MPTIKVTNEHGESFQTFKFSDALRKTELWPDRTTSGERAVQILEEAGYVLDISNWGQQPDGNYNTKGKPRPKKKQAEAKESQEQKEKKEKKEKKSRTKKIKGQHEKYPLLLDVVREKVNVLLVGPAGSGKTTAAESVAVALGLPFYPQSVGGQTTKSDLLGYMNAVGNYVPSIFRHAFEEGGLFLLDEMDAGNANVITILNAALSGSVASFPDKVVKKHQDFVLIASANTFGLGANREYVGRNQLDAATLDRFAVLEWDYDPQFEKSLSKNPVWVEFVQVIRKKVAALKMRHVVSPRATFFGETLIAAGIDVETVKTMVLYKNLNKSQIKQLEG